MNFLLYEWITDNTLVAQVIQDPDILGQIKRAWEHFIVTGQVWAFLIGIFFGYVFASFTRF